MNSIGRNTIYNLAGLGIPLVLFLVTIPLYIRAIGEARYGVLAIVWLVLGLFGMMDLGLGRAATQKIAALRGGTGDERRAALDTALAANVAIGVAGALLMAGASWYIFARGMKLDPWLRAEAMPVVPLMAIGVPVVTTLGIFSGALQGRERFFVTNRVTILNAAMFQLLPLIVAWTLGPKLWPLVLSALCARIAAVIMLWAECRREFGPGKLVWRQAETISMLRYGGWVTASGLFGMALVFTDRFVIGSILGAVAVTVYAVPLDATRRLAVIADSLANALFPRWATSDAAKSRELTSIAVGVLYSIATPTVAAFILLAEPLFRLWLGADLGARSAPLAQVLAIAGWVNIFAKPPYARLQAQGRPRVVALISLVEVPVYFVALWWALSHYSLVGAAWVYLARNTADTAMLYLFADGRIERGSLLAATFASFVALVLVLHWLPAVALPEMVAWAATACAIYGAVSWLVLPAIVREFALRWLPRVGGKQT